MAKSLQELEEIVMRLNRDLIAWQKWGHEFRDWVINELNRVKAGRPNAPTPVQEPAQSRKPDVRDLQMMALLTQMDSMRNNLDCIAADLQ